MKHTPFDELKPVATVVSPPAVSPAEIRRERLERLATVLESHRGPVRLFRQLEFMSSAERESLRGDSSPLAIAFSDPVLRSQGLKGDTYGDAIEFFNLSSSEAHHLLCDCHYSMHQASPDMIAARARSLANSLMNRLRQALAHGFDLRPRD